MIPYIFMSNTLLKSFYYLYVSASRSALSLAIGVGVGKTHRIKMSSLTTKRIYNAFVWKLTYQIFYIKYV